MNEFLKNPVIPARMINEFVYCPRLFYLEWVQGRFATSDDVEEGLYVHRVVDEPTGDLPEPEDADGPHISRSFWLTSERLGVTAKIDLVEMDADGVVVPVDYKKGSPDPKGVPWPSDVIQSRLQALLLRDAGYAVPEAQIWYATTRQRVAVALDDNAERDIRATLEHVRHVAAAREPPLPLVDSPKCPKCSLVGICLPDEVNALVAHQAQTKHRRIMAPKPDHRPVYVQEQGATVGIRRNRLEIFKDGLIASYRLLDVSQVNLQGNVSVTPQAMRELFAREIPVAWFSYGGWFSGVSSGLPSKYVDLRLAQARASAEKTLRAAQRIVEGKVRNCRTLLARNSRADTEVVSAQLRQLASDSLTTSSFPSLLGIEGTAARLYLGRFTDMLTGQSDVDVTGYQAHGRQRRPPPDPINSLLSFVYALLVKDLTTTALLVGFDPYVGVYHRPRFGRPALALDLMEEFRPIVADSVVIQVLNNREILKKDFIQRAGGCQLTAAGRKTVIGAYERRLEVEIKHPVFGYRVTYRRAFEVQARLMAAFLTGEIDDYSPFTTR